ncbi:hypothetical protein BKA67DRAFT_657711 [Truncatella angustata]|uniref:C3H1-type domain-containing protein n=1 Tax=Truncatella angustata TaxID=152316 RepID=A0A9P8UN89_9PEZI|nr:uncharacterized protein BKA67DRAFT_657711 [Truncatella angustata]KAH6655799.1 hypothetical protein BKA67DRAFT_657711 [Truncatella angustata]KAH8199387.1 hypothetical protein TruAng_006431 [Truncatella angustata]
MAQGGHGWPGGQYHASGVDQNSVNQPNSGGLEYGNGINADDNMLYMSNWDSMNQSTSNYPAPNADPADHQFYQPQTYYQAHNAFSNGNASVGQRTTTASPAAAYGNGMFQDSAFQRPQSQPQQHAHQHTYQHFSATDLNQHDPQVPGSFVEGSWSSTAPQNQYSQPMGYENAQNMYQQHIQPSSHAHAHTSTPTPPPAQRTISRFQANNANQTSAKPVMNHSSMANIQSHPNVQTANPTAPRYQFQVIPGPAGNSSYQNPAVSVAQPAAAFQGQLHYAPPSQAGAHGHFPVSPPQPGLQQASVPVKGTASTSQASDARTNELGQFNASATASAPGASYANNQQMPGQVPFTGYMQPSPAPMLTVIPARPAFDPVAHGDYTQLAGFSNLFISGTPIDGSSMDLITDDSFSFSAHFNAKDGPLTPGHPGRLPCEIRRDFKWLRKQEKSADVNDAKRRAIRLEKDRLNREMMHLIGESVESATKTGTTRSVTKRESRTGSIRVPGSESSDDSSEYESDSEYEETQEDQEARKIKMAGRPSDPVKAVEYDVIQTVWRAPDDTLPVNATAAAIQAFGVQFEKLWNKAKDLRKDIKTAKEKKSKRLDSLESELTAQLNLIHVAVQTAIKYAESSVLDNMGGNSKLAVMLWNALRGAIATKDFNGPLPKAILHLMSHFTTLQKHLVTGVFKVQEYQKKYQKDFDDICNGYLDQIQSKAKDDDDDKKVKDTAPVNGTKEPAPVVRKTPIFTAKDLVSASKKSASTDSKKVLPAGPTVLDAKRASGIVTKTPGILPSKRPRDDDVDSRITKKVAVDGSSSGTQASKPGAVPKTTTVVQPRPKSSGSILPGRARPTAKPAVKKSEPSSSTSSSLSTISGLLAEIAKPKSPPRQKDEPVKAPETEEEKTRRLRKEARRGLRVMWKPDYELEEVRIFQHDANEDEGRATNMVRDARDNRSEGQALKRAKRANESEGQDADVDKDDEDDNSEEGKPKELALQTWTEPCAIDFSHVDQVNPGQRLKNFITRGGNQTIHTEEQKVMEKYEQTQLIAIYTSPADIPETPKSPIRKEAERATVLPHISQLPTNTPNLQETQTRWREIAQLGTGEATEHMLQRLRNKSSPEVAAKYDRLLLDMQRGSMSSHDRQQPYAFAPSSAQMVSGQQTLILAPIMSQDERDAECLRLLKSERVRTWSNANPFESDHPRTKRLFNCGDPKIQADIDAIEDVAAAFAGKPFPAIEPPEHLRSNPAHVKEWQMGVEKDLAAKATSDATDRAKKLAEEFARKSLAAPAQPVPQAAVTQSAQDPNAAAWAAYFAQMNQAQAQPQVQLQSHAQAQPAQGQNLTYDQYTAILEQTQALQAQHAGHGAQVQMPQYSQQQPAQEDANSIGALLAALGGQSIQAQPAAVTTTQPAQQDPNVANAAAWAAYYASLNQGQPQQPVSQQPVSQQPVSQQQSQAQKRVYQHRDRDRSTRDNYGSGDGILDYGPSESDSHEKGVRGRKDNKDNFRGKAFDGKGINRSLIGTKPCTFWAQGKCAKGEQCTFRHDAADLK